MCKKNNTNFIFIKLIALIIIGCIFFSSCLPFFTTPVFANNSNPIINLTKGWQIRYGYSPINDVGIPTWLYDDFDSSSWQDFKPPVFKSIFQTDNNVWIRINLPDNSFEEPYIKIPKYEDFIKVYLDDKIIFDSNKNTIKDNEDFPWFTIPLPANFQNKVLTINMYSPYFTINIGRLYKTQLGTQNDITNIKNNYLPELVKTEIFYIILSFLFILIGFFLQATFFANRAIRKYYNSLGFSSIFIGIWVLTSSDLPQLFIRDGNILHFLCIVSSQLATIGFYSFVSQLFSDKFKKSINLYIYFSVIYIVIELLLSYLDVIIIVNAFYISLILSVIVFLILAYKILSNTFNYTFEKKYFAIATAFVCLCGVFDLIMLIYFCNSWPNFIFPLVIFLFLLYMLFILGKQSLYTQATLRIYSKVIAVKDKNLNDNKKLLADALAYDMLKNEFLSNVSHELRTPLNIILGSLQLFNIYSKDDLLLKNKDSIKKHVKAMQQNSCKLLKLVNNLIDSTKIDANFLELNLTNCDIISLVEDITSSTAEYFKFKDINICFDTDIEEKIIACDPDKIERIILNLLSNAIKFSKSDGEIFVTINGLENTIFITVEDNGIGIPDDNKELIFERFRKADSSLTREHEGSGIGLSLVKSLIKMHNGKIQVESEYGKGSKFILELPVKTLTNIEKKYDINSNARQSLSEKMNIEFSDIY